uniref:hypothetical protein n=1 Tax=Rhizobium sp. TaxID=391 RepID=UPI0028A60CCD
SQAEIPLIPAVQISRASSQEGRHGGAPSVTPDTAFDKDLVCKTIAAINLTVCDIDFIPPAQISMQNS